eukprot:TRINITY_DN3246_c0_g2_i1.p1 TRINITY_DN3246_c0_g2~~TRINITY_DN3246_c0_g2_i1.p1  ORF type:complete len:782 (-),score=92.04 TRINITY_DN3246_c0_g2_i1:653-2713(-)
MEDFMIAEGEEPWQVEGHMRHHSAYFAHQTFASAGFTPGFDYDLMEGRPEMGSVHMRHSLNNKGKQSGPIVANALSESSPTTTVLAIGEEVSVLELYLQAVGLANESTHMSKSVGVEIELISCMASARPEVVSTPAVLAREDEVSVLELYLQAVGLATVATAEKAMSDADTNADLDADICKRPSQFIGPLTVLAEVMQILNDDVDPMTSHPHVITSATMTAEVLDAVSDANQDADMDTRPSKPVSSDSLRTAAMPTGEGDLDDWDYLRGVRTRFVSTKEIVSVDADTDAELKRVDTCPSEARIPEGGAVWLTMVPGAQGVQASAPIPSSGADILPAADLTASPTLTHASLPEGGDLPGTRPTFVTTSPVGVKEVSLVDEITASVETFKYFGSSYIYNLRTGSPFSFKSLVFVSVLAFTGLALALLRAATVPRALHPLITTEPEVHHIWAADLTDCSVNSSPETSEENVDVSSLPAGTPGTRRRIRADGQLSLGTSAITGDDSPSKLGSFVTYAAVINQDESEEVDKTSPPRRMATRARGRGKGKGQAQAPEFEVEAVLDTRVVKGRRQYQVRWRGFPSSENSWTAVEDMENAREAIYAFHAGRAQAVPYDSRHWQSLSPAKPQDDCNEPHIILTPVRRSSRFVNKNQLPPTTPKSRGQHPSLSSCSPTKSPRPQEHRFLASPPPRR